MFNKILFLLLAFLFSLCPVFSQDEDPNKELGENRKARKYADAGDRYFNHFEYFLAADEYEKALEEDPDYYYAVHKLAESYKNYFNYQKAKSNYKRIVDQALDMYPLDQYWYAVMLKNLGEYEASLDVFVDFIDTYSGPDAARMKRKAKLDAEGAEMALQEMKEPQRNYHFEILPSPVNSYSSDYGPVIYESDTSILITSSREGTIGNQEFGMLGGYYSDVFGYFKDDKGWAAHEELGFINSEFNEGTGCFNADKTSFYFTKCDNKVKSAEYDEYFCAIYVVSADGEKWGEPVLLNENINMPGFDSKQPALSPGGDTLYFVSRRPGGYGMHDIYYSVRNGGEDWGKAVNLGEKINTAYIDMSPHYYGKENTLFFASNGREGFGGLDIYMSVGPGFDSVRNMGLPFNSNMDDFYFVTGDSIGYLSSNRSEGKGNDDIYQFRLISEEATIAKIDKDSLEGAKSISVTGKVVDRYTGEPVANVEERLKDDEGNVLKRTRTNEEGEFRFDNLPPDDYEVEIEDKDPRLVAEVEYQVEDLQLKKSGQPASRTHFENIFFDFDKSNLRREARKTLKELADYYNEHPEIQIELNANTDSYGTDEYNKSLSRRRGEEAMDYLIKKGVDRSALVINAMGEDNPFATNKSIAGRQLNRRIEFFIVGGPGYEATAMTYIIEPGKDVETIAGQFGMTVEELKELNDLNDEGNLAAYKPLRVRRTGDSDIIAPVTMASMDREVEGKEEKYRKQDRVISNLKEGEDIYIVAPKNTLFSISRLYGMTVEELKDMNNLSSDTIYIGQRLKVSVPGPDVATGKYYVVKEGDSIASVAERFGLTVKELIKLNNLKGYKLYRNMVLKVKK